MKTLTTLAVCLLLVGCTTVFNGIVTVTQVRNSVMNELGKQYRLGKIDAATDKKIDEVDKKYREAALVAERSLEIYKSTGQGDPKLIIQAVKLTVTELIDILSTYANASTQYKQLSTASKL